MKKITLLLFIFCLQYSMLNAQTVNDVNPLLFLEDGSNVTITTVSCTLSNGTTTTCFQIVSSGTPTDHNMGPWCPDNIADDASAGGLWMDNGQVYDVDGAFIQNMATFYNDNNWLMYDANGDIYTTDTQQDCANAANPNVGQQYENFCVECLPSYVVNLTQTYLIPVTPVEVNTPIQFGGGPPGPGNNGPRTRGVAFNGVAYDPPAPVNPILAAYTLAPIDDAGGHINLNAGYHYHAATGKSKEVIQCDAHAPMIGYALDGHAIYAQLNEDGTEPTDLDACRGHYDATRGYHYHVDYAGNNNFIDCLNGAYATQAGGTVTIDNDGDGYNLLQDCDDNDAALNPGAIDIANNGIDENCDGSDACDTGLNVECDVDYIVPNTAYTGDVNVYVSNTIESSGMHINDTDNEYKAGTSIALISGFEIIVGVDFCARIEDCSDCPGTVDACGVCDGSGPSDWCQDLDGDGLGNPAVTVNACTQPTGYVANCSDTDDTCNGGTVDACGVCNGSGPTDWCQDSDGDGLGNPAVTVNSCTQPTGYVANCSDPDDTDPGTDCIINGMHAAFAEFDTGSYTIYLSGTNVVLETDGLPNHVSPYWSDTHPLNITPICTSTQGMAPGDIDNFNGSYTLSVPESPVLASSTTSTGLGAIGLAVSGSVIYNDEEGPNVPLDNAVSSLDCNGAHTGPQSYHYHLEPVSWSEDDDELIGLISDGFFIYGRKCFSTGTYPTDLDASGGHTSMTQHSCDPEYHYHIENVLYLNEYYILFPGDYQGTPNNIQ